MSTPSRYMDVYMQRLNRYGNDYKSRMQNKREEEFELKLLKSVYRIDFEYDGEVHPATLERYKQDETETLHYLLTRADLNVPSGTMLELPDKDELPRPWMVYYLEHIKASGYNKYIVLKMSHFIEWKDRQGNTQQSWCYLYGQEDNMLKDELQSRSRIGSRYTENLKLSFFVMPTHPGIREDIYIEIGKEPFRQGFRVTGYDIISTPGVMYVSIDPVYLYDNSPAPEKQVTDADEDFFWLEGGN